jgi:hypothetical protein
MKAGISNFRFQRGVRIVFVLAFVWLAFTAVFRSNQGRALLVRVIHAAAGERVQVTGAFGDWPFRGGLASLVVADRRGPWLVVSNVTWRIHARDLMQRPLRVRELQADAVELLRLPERTLEPRVSSMPPLRIDALRVGVFHPATNLLAGAAVKLDVVAGVEHGSDGWLVLADGREAASGASVSAVLRTGLRPVVSVQVHEPGGGPISHRLKRGTAGFSATLWAEREWVGWRGSLVFDAGTQGLVRAGWSRATNGVWEADVAAERLSWAVVGRTLELDAARLQWIPGERRGRYQVAARYAGEPVWAEGALTRRSGGLSLPNMLVTADGLRARMTLQRGEQWQGEGRITVHREAALARLLAGCWDAEGRVTLDWAGPRFHVAGNFPSLHTPAGECLDVNVDLQRAEAAVISLDAGVASVQRAGVAWVEDVHVRGAIEPKHPGWQLSLERAVARHGAVEANLREPFVVTSGPEGLVWSTARLSVASGEFTTHGTVGTNLQVFAECSALPLAGLVRSPSSGLEGVLTGRLAFQGTLESPELYGHLEGHDLRLRNPGAGVELTPAEASADLRVGHGRAGTELTWSGWSDDPMRAVGEGPVLWSLRPWRLSIPRDEPGRGSFRGTMDLARLERVFDLRGARVRGRLEAALDLSGTLDSPDIQGRLAVVEGQVDVPETGTALRDIQLELVGDRERLLIRKGSAHDGASGRLILEGSVLFDPDQSFPMAARLQLKQAALWQHGGSRAVLDGELDLLGTIRALTLRGQLQAPIVQVRLGHRRVSVPRLPIVDLDMENRNVLVVPPQETWGQRVKLEVGLSVPRTAEISGRGLEANWRAHLTVGGTLAAPQVSGSAQADRGYFLFMGRRFDLESTWVGLDGRRPPQPELNLLATSRSGEMLARLHASGPIREPLLELTSDPAYPTDEVLSRLLFGKSADSISAFQAVRLAHGLNVLRGKGTTLDMLDRGQSLLRVDQLDLRQDAEQGTVSSVSVGKYIGRRVFVQGETALDGSSDVIAVEVDLAPSLTLQTEASPGIREGIGLKWRRDY